MFNDNTTFFCGKIGDDIFLFGASWINLCSFDMYKIYTYAICISFLFAFVVVVQIRYTTHKNSLTERGKKVIVEQGGMVLRQ